MVGFRIKSCTGVDMSNSKSNSSIFEILEQYRKISRSERELGERFERLMLNYLKKDTTYQQYFSEVWLWMDFPKRGNMPDTGIDLVGLVRDTGDYCAIQCKCYDLERTLEKSDIDSFFTASGTNLLKKRMIISTTNKWSKNAEAALKNQQIPVVRVTIYDLANSSIDWDKYNLNNPDYLELKPKKQIRPHQEIAIEKVITGFETADRGKLIMACGTGKTFTSLKIAERFPKENNLILFLVPSISLLSQTLREWTAESEIDFHSIAVCSDTNVGKSKRKSQTDDRADITVNDLAFPPTTNAQDIVESYYSFNPHKLPFERGEEEREKLSLKKGKKEAEKLSLKKGEKEREKVPLKNGKEEAEKVSLKNGKEETEKVPLKNGKEEAEKVPLKNGDEFKLPLSKEDLGGLKFSLSKEDLGGLLTIIFSTYQSIQAISEAQKVGLPELDLIICDEAHRTTGVTVAGTD
ncbi:DEAD/DEAH box helicase family protein [Dapis sp. BLCC M172]